MRFEPVVGLNGGGREGKRNIEKTRRRQANKISVEEYNCFSQIRDPNHLTIHHLNQIIEMHGFMKIHKAPKKVLTAVVDSLELMDPSRSTLGDNVTSSCAFITLEEAILDLAALNWQDSYVTNSLQTLNLNNNNNSSLELHNIKVECVSNPIPKRKRTRKLRPSSSSLNLHNIKVEEGVSTPIPKRKRSRKRMLRLASLNGYNSSSPPTTTTGNGFGSPSGGVGASAGGARKLVPRRKRIVRSDEFGSTVW